MPFSRRICLDAVLILALLFAVSTDCAADRFTTTSRGVSGDRDKQARDPELSVTRIVEGENVKLLVDAHVPNSDYRHYPIRFDFYLNRQLFASQMRSQTLPGPIGVDIGPDSASLPFNYTVVARVLHPNRTFTTIIEGAAFSSNLTDELDCTLTVGEGDDAEDYFDDSVPTTQVANQSFSIAFDGFSSTGEPASAEGLINLQGTQAVATLNVLAGQVLRPIATSGTAELSEGGAGIDLLELKSADGLTLLNCE